MCRRLNKMGMVLCYCTASCGMSERTATVHSPRPRLSCCDLAADCVVLDLPTGLISQEEPAKQEPVHTEQSREGV
jgi:hypothetical protein